MPVHIDELVTNIRVSTSELAISEEQLDAIVTAVTRKLKQAALEQEMLKHTMGVPVEARPPLRFRE